MTETIKCPTCGRSSATGSYCDKCGKPLQVCRICRAPISKESVYCSKCGTLISEERKRRLTQQRISWGWWLLPVFSPILLFSPWVGGVMAWAINKDKNPRIARFILFFGISLSIIMAIVFFALGWGIVI